MHWQYDYNHCSLKDDINTNRLVNYISVTALPVYTIILSD